VTNKNKAEKAKTSRKCNSISQRKVKQHPFSLGFVLVMNRVERNALDGQAPEDSSYTLQKVRPPLLSHKKGKVLGVRLPITKDEELLVEMEANKPFRKKDEASPAQESKDSPPR